MIGIIDYDIGNVGSVANALRKLDVSFIVSRDSNVLDKADALILPGVGSANGGMENLYKLKLTEFIKNEILNGKPIIGICLGMQILFDSSEEGNTKCLGILKGKVKKFKKEKKIPQIGWNQVIIQQYNNVAMKQFNNKFFYFVNSYYCIPEDKSIVVGSTKYGEEFTSIIQYKNIFATQFHPEKSGQIGLQFLRNIINKWTEDTSEVAQRDSSDGGGIGKK